MKDVFFSASYLTTDVSGILNIHKYLLEKQDIV